MKTSIFRNALLGSAVAATIATLSFSPPATAQTDTTTTTPTDDTTGVVEDDNDGFDWGLLGLLGLLGLAGLARKHDDRVTYRDPNADPATTTRSDYTNLR